MKRQVRVVSTFILITFLFSTFVIPTNINARVDVRFTQEVNFGEPGSLPSPVANSVNSIENNPDTIVGTGSNQELTKNKDLNIWFVYSNILLSQIFSVLL